MMIKSIFCCLTAVAFSLSCHSMQDPKALDALARIEAFTAEEGKTAKENARNVDSKSILKFTLETANKAIEGVNPSSIPPVDAAEWGHLFTYAGKYSDAVALYKQALKASENKDRFTGLQVSLIKAATQAKDFKSVRDALDAITPINTEDMLFFSRQVTFSAPNLIRANGLNDTLRLVGKAEKLLDSVSPGEDANPVSSARQDLTQIKDLAAKNHGKEAEAIEAASRAKLISALSSMKKPPVNNPEREARHAKLIGQPAGDLNMVDQIGELQNLQNYKGKVVLLDFFAHWCGPCRAALPGIRDLHELFKDKGLQVIGVTQFYGYFKTEKNISSEIEKERMVGFSKDVQISWPIAFVTRKGFDAFGAAGIPHVVIIDKKGVVRLIRVGNYQENHDLFKKEIEKLLAE